jgi:hypothetical protein
MSDNDLEWVANAELPSRREMQLDAEWVGDEIRLTPEPSGRYYEWFHSHVVGPPQMTTAPDALPVEELKRLGYVGLYRRREADTPSVVVSLQTTMRM